MVHLLGVDDHFGYGDRFRFDFDDRLGGDRFGLRSCHGFGSHWNFSRFSHGLRSCHWLCFDDGSRFIDRRWIGGDFDRCRFGRFNRRRFGGGYFNRCRLGGFFHGVGFYWCGISGFDWRRFSGFFYWNRFGGNFRSGFYRRRFDSNFRIGHHFNGDRLGGRRIHDLDRCKIGDFFNRSVFSGYNFNRCRFGGFFDGCGFGFHWCGVSGFNWRDFGGFFHWSGVGDNFRSGFFRNRIGSNFGRSGFHWRRFGHRFSSFDWHSFGVDDFDRRGIGDHFSGRCSFGRSFDGHYFDWRRISDYFGDRFHGFDDWSNWFHGWNSNLGRFGRFLDGGFKRCLLSRLLGLQLPHLLGLPSGLVSILERNRR